MSINQFAGSADRTWVHPWDTVPFEDRPVWVLDPLRQIGPLQFAASMDTVEELMGPWSSHGGYQDGPQQTRFGSKGVTCYSYEGRLCAVVVDASRGPRVTLDRFELVGQTPSQVDAWLLQYCQSRGMELLLNQHCDPCTDALGLIVRGQRSHDIVLTRVVAVCEDWADRCGDTSEGWIPDSEWNYW
ncbi:hypothetical protein GCM10010530_07510 [Kribbella aluminosa]